MTWPELIFTVCFSKWQHNPGRRELKGLSRKRNPCRLIAAVLLGAALAAPAAPASAGCNEDCKSEYVSALGECRTEYQRGDEDLHDLEDCLVDTRGEYEDCIDDCTSLGAGGVVACVSAGARVTAIIFTTPATR